MLEFPRPTYPGDFISCSYYQKPDDFDFFQVFLDGENGSFSDYFELSLPHGGVVYNQLYEIVFEPALFTVDEETCLSVFLSYGDEQILFHEQFSQCQGQVLSALRAYFSPSAVYASAEDIVYQDFRMYLVASGPGLVSFQWGRHETPTVFAVRPVDETNNDTFRLIRHIDEDYAS